MLEACASIRSFLPKDAPKPPDSDGGVRRAERDFRGEKWSNATHQSATGPDARLYRKGDGQAAKLVHMSHAPIENRNGLVVGAAITEANGMAEREARLKLLDELPKRGRRRTVGCDKGCDAKDFVNSCRDRCITPQVAQRRTGSAIDQRTTRHRGYAVSMTKRVKEPFGWGKTTGTMRKLRH